MTSLLLLAHAGPARWHPGQQSLRPASMAGVDQGPGPHPPPVHLPGSPCCSPSGSAGKQPSSTPIKQGGYCMRLDHRCLRGACPARPDKPPAAAAQEEARDNQRGQAPLVLAGSCRPLSWGVPEQRCSATTRTSIASGCCGPEHGARVCGRPGAPASMGGASLAVEERAFVSPCWLLRR
jgi:hypothetical protein